jgi:SNF2 family DNA or RNA helicase
MLKLELDEDQKEVLQFSLSNPYSIMSMQMGMGKSAVAIAVKDSLPNSRCLVICPSYLTLMWKAEIEKFLSGQIVTLFKRKIDVFFPVDSDFVIASYEIATETDILFQWANMVIIDEATAIKNMLAKRTEKIHRFVFENSIPRVYLLTGTPILNRIEEFYSLIALCNYNPKIKESKFLARFPDKVSFADNFSHRHEFEIMRGNQRIKILRWDGVQREDELREWLRGVYIRKKSRLAAINYKDVVLDDFDDEDLADAFDNYDNTSSVAPSVKAAAALRMVPLTVKYIKGLIELEEIEGPVIIYTDHRESCHALAKAFNTPGITGEMSSFDRQKLGEAFQEGRMPFLVATIGSFSTGVTLTKSNFMVINDLPWVPGMLEQAAYRINRKGQERPCYVHRILGSKQSAYILDTLLSKGKVIEKVY